jgi:hypothetical protein
MKHKAVAASRYRTEPTIPRVSGAQESILLLQRFKRFKGALLRIQSTNMNSLLASSARA